eukprot:TRINITY_DN24890_c0_g1_i1.p1 TRINITY_DN24890_c0_g1~~TRINITY_DN24890_c0_g1_i1.p1  ORF type:complete len:341 (+),score=47.85 TRINITY_DN24890_c0_g1_i1:85-1107(+)
MHIGNLLEVSGAKGGGQVFRNAMTYAALVDRGVRITEIRGARKPPGLKRQHLTCAEVCRDITKGELEAALKSTIVNFQPSGRLHGGDFEADTVTAGSCTLLLQCALPLLAFADKPVSVLTIKGGTDVPMSPPLDFFRHIFLPAASWFGLHAKVLSHRRGVFPKGQGYVSIEVQKVKGVLEAVEVMDIGFPVGLCVECFVARGLDVEGARREASKRLLSQFGEKFIEALPEGIHINVSHEPSVDNGSGVFTYLRTSTGILLPTLSPPTPHTPPVSEHLQDQLIILMALARGTSRFLTGPITPHTEEAIKVAEMLTKARFTITPHEGANNVISCEGVGYNAP